MKILFEDENIIVCVKPVGVSSEEGMVLALSEITGCKIYTLHRLDTAVGGVMVYAKNRTSAAYLSREIAEKRLVKKYLAVISGELAEDSGEMCDLLFKDSRKNKSYVVSRERKGVKKARLTYEVLQKKGPLSLVSVTLDTGRSHQIRVQFSHRGASLFGDGKYGSKFNGNIGLFSHSLTFAHPVTKQKLTFSEIPDYAPFTEFEI